MNILAIETTSVYPSVAVLNEDNVIMESESTEKLNHHKMLIPLIDQTLKKMNLTMEEITGISVSQGPGSFTGIRIGISTARALAQALHIKIATISSLEAMSYFYHQQEGIFCPMLDARKDQVYAAIYQHENGKQKEIFPQGVYPIDEILDFTEKKPVAYFGDGMVLFQEKIQARSELAIFLKEEKIHTAASIAVLGRQKFDEGKGVEYSLAEPAYFRKSEAERNLENRVIKR